MRLLLILSLAVVASVAHGQSDDPYLIVLGVAQDGGIPQAGSAPAIGADGEQITRNVVSIALVDPVDSLRWLFDATPDFRSQLQMLDADFPVRARPPGLAGIFLTHAHMGHYTGLMFLGYESMSARRLPVYALPSFISYIRENGPWDQLVSYDNIELIPLSDGLPVTLNSRISVTPILVPHRQEYSEVVGFRIEGPNRKVLFIPDIDGWEEWDAAGDSVEDHVRSVDVAYLDGTFFSNGEIPGRDMTGFPHPFISESISRFSHLPAAERDKIRFIHLNHTNPVIYPESDARQFVIAKGFRLADEGEKVGL